MGVQTDKVRFNVGGKIFETTATTLANAGRNSMFGAMFDDQWNFRPREINDEYFIDRDPECFPILLNLLRTGKLHVLPSIPEKLLYEEALYYGLLDNVRSAKWGRFDGNKLKLTSSVKGPALHDCTAIRASPDGGCAVAHGSIVHVYNWMLEEREPLNLDYRIVNDIAWMDSENIVVSAGQRLGEGYGGMGLFSSSTGELRHRYEVKSQTAGALCFNSDGKIFACCGGTSSENGIGVWDQLTGKQVDIYKSTSGRFLGNAGKIEWLDRSNCLFISALSPWGKDSHVCLLDIRTRKKLIWSWSELAHIDGVVYDAIAMEESNSVCLVNEYEDLGFLDLRSAVPSIQWKPSNLENRKYDQTCYPKLALHDGQVFCSMDDGISVFSGPDKVLTSSLGRSCGGSIRDFSIGGDRLFVLHNAENMFDVWEAPSPPLI
ncbi:hypothetical protein MKW98_006060 [Papaver atlanticum]|uniref:BTB domain-containing protein n=1 Tax=Papaver atlanticum TaxID=357466 RepID=A0AAD4XW08_9MAGN|nr:hypothetical protein MKW98_006060 [Papaver atlanticum]